MAKKIQERPSDPAVPQDEFMRGMAEGMWIAMTLVSAMMGHVGDARSNRTIRERMDVCAGGWARRLGLDPHTVAHGTRKASGLPVWRQGFWWGNGLSDGVYLACRRIRTPVAIAFGNSPCGLGRYVEGFNTCKPK